MQGIRSSRNAIVLLLVIVLTSLSSLAQTAPENYAKSVNSATGHARLLTFAAGVLGMPARDRTATALTVATDAVSRYAGEFGAAAGSGYQITGSPITLDSVAGGVTGVRFVQTLGGVPVFGSQIAANVRGDGALLLMAGDVSSVDAASLNLSPAIAASTAGQTALDYVALRYGVGRETLAVKDAGLWIYDPAVVGPGPSVKKAGLVWQAVVVSTAGLPIRVVVLVSAEDANVSFAFNSLHASTVYGDWHTAEQAGLNFGAGLVGPAAVNDVMSSPRVPGTADLSTHDANNTTTLPGTFVCDEGTLACTSGADPDADKAHAFANGTYNLYYTLHGRDSLNNAGMLLRSTVHYSSAYCNAFWNGSQMAYGDGCSIVHDDVVGHELTHGVTEFTSNLIYAYDSGAINESFSDVWGEFYDLGNGTAEDIAANRWVIGEEISAGGFRNMKNPPLKSDPDRVGSPIFWTDARDTGGVHINSGINNKAAFLMADGETFNGQTVTGLGMVKPLHIYYYVQTMLAGASSTYNDLGVFLSAACDALVGGGAGISAADCDEVDKAVLATEMALESPHLPDSAEVCSVGQTVQDVFFDDFENAGTSAANWTTAFTEGSNAWTVSSTSNPLSGTRSMRADNVAASSDSTSRLTTGVVIPAGAFLHFEQQYLWEYDGWDGGIIQYSTDGGANWTKFNNADMTGELYPGLMDATSDAAFPGQAAYTGDSFGAGSTRISLAAFSGQTLMIRFFASSDISFSAGNPDGWWIDNVRIYTCVTPGSSTDLLVNGDFELDVDTNNIPDNWGTNQAKAKTCLPAQVHNGTCAAVIKGSALQNLRIKQNVDTSGVTLAVGDTLDLSAFVLSAKPTSKLQLMLKVFYAGNPVPSSVKTVINQLSVYTEVTAPQLTLTGTALDKVVVLIKNKTLNGKAFIDLAELIHTPVGPRSSEILPPPSAPSGMRGSN